MIKVLISKNRVVSHYVSYKKGKYINICLFLFTKELRTIIYLSKQ